MRFRWTLSDSVPSSVFVADDHAIVRDGLEQVLRVRPRVVIMDISMPEPDGIEATRQIMAALPETSIVIHSMHSGSRYVFQALEAGARGYLLEDSASAKRSARPTVSVDANAKCSG